MEDQATSTESSAKKSMSPAIIIGIIGLIIIIGAGAFFMSKKNTTTTAPQTTTQQPTVEVTQAPAMESEATTPSGAMTKGAEKSFEVDGSNFKFSPSTLTVNEGDTVKITFKNTQGFHNFIIDEFNAKSKTIPANQTDELTFVANKKGTFEFYCGVGNHRAMGMKGTLTVK